MTLGYNVPEDISVIGFDDLPISQHLNPPLTTIRQDRLELGKCGYYILYRLLGHVPLSKSLLRPTIVYRASTAEAKERPFTTFGDCLETDSVDKKNPALYDLHYAKGIIDSNASGS